MFRLSAQKGNQMQFLKITLFALVLSITGVASSVADEAAHIEWVSTPDESQVWFGFLPRHDGTVVDYTAIIVEEGGGSTLRLSVLAQCGGIKGAQSESQHGVYEWGSGWFDGQDCFLRWERTADWIVYWIERCPNWPPAVIEFVDASKTAY